MTIEDIINKKVEELYRRIDAYYEKQEVSFKEHRQEMIYRCEFAVQKLEEVLKESER